jgi:hypothetical protein
MGRPQRHQRGRDRRYHAPAWRAELKDKLVAAEPGLFRLRPDIEQAILRELPIESELTKHQQAVLRRKPENRQLNLL